MSTLLPSAVPWGDGAPLTGTPFRLVVSAEQTTGHAVVLTVDMPPGLRVDAHTHTDEDQINIVVSGTVRCRVGDVESVLGAGGILVMPRDIEHELWNDTDDFVRIIEIYTPPGIEHRFAAAGAAADGEATAADYARAGA